MTVVKNAILGALMCTAFAACDSPILNQGFSLPEGDAAAGKATFTELGCHICHTVSGHRDLREGLSFDPEMSIMLGGAKPSVQTYADLVTSVINPSHRLARGYPKEAVSQEGQSRMLNYNSTMTVEELIDVVTFLQDQYELPPYPPTTYTPYRY